MRKHERVSTVIVAVVSTGRTLLELKVVVVLALTESGLELDWERSGTTVSVDKHRREEESLTTRWALSVFLNGHSGVDSNSIGTPKARLVLNVRIVAADRCDNAAEDFSVEELVRELRVVVDHGDSVVVLANANWRVKVWLESDRAHDWVPFEPGDRQVGNSVEDLDSLVSTLADSVGARGIVD